MKYPREVQNELLSILLNKAQNTEMGIRYDFTNINITIFYVFYSKVFNQ